MAVQHDDNGRLPHERPVAAPSLRGNISELMHDLATMGDLQLKLLGVDSRAMLNRARLPAAVGAAAVVLVMGATPVLLLGLAHLLAESLLWPLSAAYSLVAGVALCLGGLTLWLAYRQLCEAARPLERSRCEFNENVAWIRRAIRTQGQIKGPVLDACTPASRAVLK
jgi:hypothetical protein